MHRTHALALLTAAALAAGSCNRGQSSGPPPAFPPTPVGLVVAKVATIEDATEYVATLKSLRSTTVQPQAEGQITQIFVKAGDHVTQGAPVAQIDQRRQEAAVSTQEAEFAAREAAVTYAQQQARRMNELFAGGAVSKQELDQADTNLRTAEGNLKSLQAQLQQQQVQLKYFTVVAPTAGVVGDVPARVGKEVTLQTVLTTIDDNETLELNVSVPVERASDLHTGLPVRILSSEGPDTLASTTINFVSPQVDDQTQSVLVKALVRNPGLKLRPQQYVRARIVWKTADGLVIPVTSVVRVSGQFFAFVAERADGKTVAHQRAIKVGPIAGNDYPVLEGIMPGERVVTSGAQKLADGAPIQDAPQPQP